LQIKAFADDNIILICERLINNILVPICTRSSDETTIIRDVTRRKRDRCMHNIAFISYSRTTTYYDVSSDYSHQSRYANIDSACPNLVENVAHSGPILHRECIITYYTIIWYMYEQLYKYIIICISLYLRSSTVYTLYIILALTRKTIRSYDSFTSSLWFWSLATLEHKGVGISTT